MRSWWLNRRDYLSRLPVSLYRLRRLRWGLHQLPEQRVEFVFIDLHWLHYTPKSNVYSGEDYAKNVLLGIEDEGTTSIIVGQ